MFTLQSVAFEALCPHFFLLLCKFFFMIPQKFHRMVAFAVYFLSGMWGHSIVEWIQWKLFYLIFDLLFFVKGFLGIRFMIKLTCVIVLSWVAKLLLLVQVVDGYLVVALANLWKSKNKKQTISLKIRPLKDIPSFFKNFAEGGIFIDISDIIIYNPPLWSGASAHVVRRKYFMKEILDKNVFLLTPCWFFFQNFTDERSYLQWHNLIYIKFLETITSNEGGARFQIAKKYFYCVLGNFSQN